MTTREALLAAYRSTDYEVSVHGCLHVIRIDRCLPKEISALLEAHGTNDAAYLSAANPRSRMCDDADNAQRHTALLRALAEQGVRWLPASGRDPCGQWPAERSVLAIGLNKARALRLAEHFAQNAYLQLVRDAPARLVLTAHWHTSINSQQ